MTPSQITDTLAFSLRTGNKENLTTIFEPFVSVIFGSHSTPTNGSETRQIESLKCKKLYDARVDTVNHKNGDRTVKITTPSGQKMAVRFWYKKTD